MNRLDHVIEITKSSHQHLPALLSLLVGLAYIKKEPFLYIGDRVPGDNIPVTLIESVRRREKCVK